MDESTLSKGMFHIRSLLSAALLVFSGSIAAAPLDLVLLLENSAAVKQLDPDRRLRDALAGFVRSLGPDDRAAVILYDDLAMPVLTLTSARGETRGDILDALNALDFNSEYSNSAAGLERAIYELNENGRAGAQPGIVLLQASPIRVGDEQQDRTFKSWIHDVLTDNADHAGIPVHVISLGGDADTQLGRHLSSKTGGLHRIANEARGMEQTFTQLSQALAQGRIPISEPTQEPTQERVPGPMQEPIPAKVEGGPLTPVQEHPQPEVEPVVAPMPKSDLPSGQPTAAPPSSGIEPIPIQTPEQAGKTSFPATPEHTQAGFPWQGHIMRYGPVAGILVLISLLVYMAWRIRGKDGDKTGNTESGDVADEPRLVDIDQATGRSHYVLTGRLARISRTESQDTFNVLNVTIRDDVISREHAFIELRDGAWWLTDTGSNNGSFHNEERVRGSVKLSSGDMLRFATYAFRFECPEPGDDAEDATRLASAQGQTGGIDAADEGSTHIAAAHEQARAAGNPDEHEDRIRIRPEPGDAESDATQARPPGD